MNVWRLISIVAVVILPVTGLAGGALTPPERVCAVLADEGLDGRWDRLRRGGYGCQSQQRPIGPPPEGAVVRTNVTLLVEGRARGRAEIAVLVMNLHDPVTRDAGKAELARLTSLLFERLETPLPDGLIAAITDGKAALFQTAFGTARLTITRGEPDRFRVVLRDAGIVR